MSKAQKDRPRLGRGLSSLISVSELPVEAEIDVPQALPANQPGSASPPAAVTSAAAPVPPAHSVAAKSDGRPLEISLADIVPNPHQPRKSVDDVRLAELAASMKSTGLIQPIVVRKHGAGYELIAGERRLRAAKIAGLETIPAFIRDVDSFTQAQMALIENIQREDLNPVDRAAAYRALIAQLGLTQAELAGRLGEDRSSIANFLRLLDLAEPVKNLVRDETLSLGHAKLLAGITDILEQERLANLVVSQGLSVRNLERLLQEGPAAKPRPEPVAPSAYYQELEKSLTSQLGMRVHVRAGEKKGRGRLVIHYASLDEFDALMVRLGVEAE
jgi:ParB family chromosome partitioning protein